MRYLSCPKIISAHSAAAVALLPVQLWAFPVFSVERAAKPLSSLSLTGNVNTPQKVAAIVAVSKELAERLTPDALEFIGNESRFGIAAETDTAFIH
jgi:hypothetical protein